jgi:hypothetical protein
MALKIAAQVLGRGTLEIAVPEAQLSHLVSTNPAHVVLLLVVIMGGDLSFSSHSSPRWVWFSMKAPPHTCGGLDPKQKS